MFRQPYPERIYLVIILLVSGFGIIACNAGDDSSDGDAKFTDAWTKHPAGCDAIPAFCCDPQTGKVTEAKTKDNTVCPRYCPPGTSTGSRCADADTSAGTDAAPKDVPDSAPKDATDSRSTPSDTLITDAWIWHPAGCDAIPAYCCDPDTGEVTQAKTKDDTACPRYCPPGTKTGSQCGETTGEGGAD